MNLMEELIAEINRIRETVMPAYIEIGSAGMLALALMRNSIKNAEKAMASGDVLAMLSAYKDLKEIEL